MTTLAYTLEQAEADLRNVYWYIRGSRTTNWKHVNKARWIKQAMRRMGVTPEELKNAVHCLKTFNCQRCNWNSENGQIPCWAISERRKKKAKAG